MAAMKLISGRSEIAIGLIDGPVAIDHPDLASEEICTVPGKVEGRCTRPDSVACMHGSALDYASKRGAVVVMAAGNQGSVGSTVITRHPWVITVAGHGDVRRRGARDGMSAIARPGHRLLRQSDSRPGARWWISRTRTKCSSAGRFYYLWQHGHQVFAAFAKNSYNGNDINHSWASIQSARANKGV
jgi:hypothetical protein